MGIGSALVPVMVRGGSGLGGGSASPSTVGLEAGGVVVVVKPRKMKERDLGRARSVRLRK